MYKTKEILYECSKCGQPGALLVIDEKETYKSICIFCNKKEIIAEV